MSRRGSRRLPMLRRAQEVRELRPGTSWPPIRLPSVRLRRVCRMACCSIRHVQHVGEQHRALVSGDDSAPVADAGTAPRPAPRSTCRPCRRLRLDGAQNTNTGMLWQSLPDTLAAANCACSRSIRSAMAVTGNTICPAFASAAERGGRTTRRRTRISRQGSSNEGPSTTSTRLERFSTRLSSGVVTSGMAFNAATRHLFVVQQAVTRDSGSGSGQWVRGSEQLRHRRSEPSRQRGRGRVRLRWHLWVVDQLGANPLLVVESGEEGSGPAPDPTCRGCRRIRRRARCPRAAVAREAAATNPFPVAVTFDSAGLFPGLRQASAEHQDGHAVSGALRLGSNFTVRFLDVPLNVPPGTNPFENASTARPARTSCTAARSSTSARTIR